MSEPAVSPRVARWDPALLSLKWTEANIPIALRTRRLATVSARGRSQERAAQRCEDFVASLRERYVTSKRAPQDYPADPATIGRGLSIVGPPGTGKTLLAGVTLTETVWRYGQDVLFAHWPEYVTWRMDAISGSLAADPDLVAVVRRLDRARSAAVVVLDDVGAEYRSQSGWSNTEFAGLLRSRHEHGRPTIVTTNVPTKGWASAWGEPTASFLRGANDVVAITDADQRRED